MVEARRSKSAYSNEWWTPPYILEALGPFDDDPAKPGSTDGLDRVWTGFVWLNPPYSHVKHFMKKLAEHGHGIGLVYARVETRWFTESVWNRASGVLFLKGRLRFLRNGIEGDVAGASSCLVAYGAEALGRLKRSGLRGVLVTSWEDVDS